MRDGEYGPPILDDDGLPITEIEVDDVDAAFGGDDASLHQLASQQRAWRFGHVIVDEAQDLTPMQWRMIARRARGGSMTLVGDLAQRSIGAPGAWRDHLPASIGSFSYQELSVNYRSPAEVGEIAASALAELAPELRPPVSIRHAVHPPRSRRLEVSTQLGSLVQALREEIDGGEIAVIGATDDEAVEIDGVRWLSPWQSKGLEFDAAVVVEPARMLDEANGLSLLFVALTRTTDLLVVAHERELPAWLARHFED